MTMTEKLNIDNGFQRQMKEHQALTLAIRKFGSNGFRSADSIAA